MSMPPGGMLPRELADRLDALFRSDPHSAHLGALLIEWSLDHASVGCTIGDHHTNFLGGGHGGVVFSLADIAMSFAGSSDGRVAMAVQIDISYMRGVRPGDHLVATATVTNRTRRFAHASVEVSAGDRLVAAATGVNYRTDEWHFGANAWPQSWRDAH
ncbi:MAG: PaaI family thioesterase [Actinomycetia bacterium]|nr:PaaI family thioesterase [Actinomycetes bacterium]